MLRRPLSVSMNRRQIIAGLIYLPCYLIFLSLGLELLLRRLLKVELTQATLNICFYAVNTVIVLLLFGPFLRENFARTEWKIVFRKLPKALLVYFGVSIAVNSAVLLLQPDFANQNTDAILGILQDSPVFIFFLTVVLAPLIEETIFRGLIFGNLLRVNRLLAYAVTALCFAGIHVINFISTLTPADLLLSILQYFPAAAVLCAVYEKRDTIAAPMLLHGCINLIACLAMGAM